MSVLVVHRYKIKTAVQMGYFERNRNETNNKNLCNKVKVTRPSYFVGVPSYFEALWYPHLYFDRKSNI